MKSGATTYRERLEHVAMLQLCERGFKLAERVQRIFQKKGTMNRFLHFSPHLLRQMLTHRCASLQLAPGAARAQTILPVRAIASSADFES